MMIQQVIKGRTMTDVTMLDAGNNTNGQVFLKKRHADSLSQKPWAFQAST